MENDLISRSALIEAFRARKMTDAVPNYDRASSEVKAAIGEYAELTRALVFVAPAVDAEPVRHGRWMPYYEPMECFVDVYLNTEIRDVQVGWICSECGRHEQHSTVEEMPYCHCGAKMDAEVEE